MHISLQDVKVTPFTLSWSPPGRSTSRSGRGIRLLAPRRVRRACEGDVIARSERPTSPAGALVQRLLARLGRERFVSTTKDWTRRARPPRFESMALPIQLLGSASWDSYFKGAASHVCRDELHDAPLSLKQIGNPPQSDFHGCGCSIRSGHRISYRSVT